MYAKHMINTRLWYFSAIRNNMNDEFVSIIKDGMIDNKLLIIDNKLFL